MIAGRTQAICRPNCRSTRLSKQRSWPIEIAWIPSNLWEKWGWWQGWATGMKDCRQSELQWSQTSEGESLSPHWHRSHCLWRDWEAYSFSPSVTFCIHRFLSTSLLLSSVSLLSIFTVHAMERDGCFQWKIQSTDTRDFSLGWMPLQRYTCFFPAGSLADSTSQIRCIQWKGSRRVFKCCLCRDMLVGERWGKSDKLCQILGRSCDQMMSLEGQTVTCLLTLFSAQCLLAVFCNR